VFLMFALITVGINSGFAQNIKPSSRFYDHGDFKTFTVEIDFGAIVCKANALPEPIGFTRNGSIAPGKEIYTLSYTALDTTTAPLAINIPKGAVCLANSDGTCPSDIDGCLEENQNE